MRWYKVLEAIVILLLVHYGNCTNISCPDSPVQLGATVNVTVDFDVDLRTLDRGSISIEFYLDGNTSNSKGDSVSCDWTKGIEHVECTFNKTRYRHSFQERPAKLVLTILYASRNDVGIYKFQMVSSSGSIDTSNLSCTLYVEGFIVTSSPGAVTTTIGAPSPSSQLDGGEITGIVIGVMALIAILIGLLVWYCKWRRGKKRNGDARKDDSERPQNECSLFACFGQSQAQDNGDEIEALNRSTKTTKKDKDRKKKEEATTSKKNKFKDKISDKCKELIKKMKKKKANILCIIVETEEMKVVETYVKNEEDEKQRVNQILEKIIDRSKNEPLFVLWDLKLSGQPNLTATETFFLTGIYIGDIKELNNPKFSHAKKLILEQFDVSPKSVEMWDTECCNYWFIVENAKVKAGVTFPDP